MEFSHLMVLFMLTCPIMLEMIADHTQCSPIIRMQSLEPAQGGAMAEYQNVKSSLHERRREMCSFLLNDLESREDERLELDKVTRLFEASLDHLAKTTSYVTLMRPYVRPELVGNFDKDAGVYVLKISDRRRKLIAEYAKAEATGASDQEKRDLLESYFFEACESKLSTIVAEKAMYDSAQKAERLMRVNLLAGDAAH